MAAQSLSGQDSAETSATAQAPSEQARAALWTGILGAAKHLGKRAPLAATPRPNVVQLRTGAAGAPIYFIGTGLSEFNLAQAVAADRAIFAVDIPWPAAWHDAVAANLTTGLPTVEQLVAPYAAAVAAHGGGAPCVLAGYSFAGLMAFEAAHQLTARGIAVATVLLLDAPANYPKSHEFAWKKLQEIWRQSASRRLAARRLVRSVAVVGVMLVDKARGFTGRVGDWLKPPPAKLTTKLDDLGRPLPWALIKQLYDNASPHYRLRPLDTHGVLFRARRRDQCPSRNLDRDLGWAGLFDQGLDVIDVAGDHLSVMREPRQIAALAAAISAAL